MINLDDDKCLYFLYDIYNQQALQNLSLSHTLCVILLYTEVV